MTSRRLALTFASAVLAAGATCATPFLLQGCGSDGDDDASSVHDGAATDASLGSPADSEASADGAATTGDGGSGGGVSLAKACNDLAYARCQALASCSNNSLTVQRWGTVTECEVRLGEQCLLNLAATGTGATPASTEACAQALPSADCDDIIANDVPEECEPVAGALANGAHCFTSAQCQSTFCDLSATAECGVCARIPQSGDSCNASTDCGDQTGLGCVSGHCVQYEAVGTHCASGVTLCGPGVVCTTFPADPDAGTGADASCLPQGTQVGALCSTSNAGAPGCDGSYGLVCTSGACATVDYVFDAGDPCDAVTVRCGGNGLCVGGACIEAVIADGTPCDTKNGPLCLPQARCITTGGTSGTCVSLGNATCAQ